MYNFNDPAVMADTCDKCNLRIVLGSYNDITSCTCYYITLDLEIMTWTDPNKENWDKYSVLWDPEESSRRGGATV